MRETGTMIALEGDGEGIAYEGRTLELSDAAINAANPTDPIDCIIVREGWGATGYYSKELLSVSEGNFMSGTRSFQGHPLEGQEEPSDRVVGISTENARYVESDPEAGGKATIRAPFGFFSDVAPRIRERAKAKAIALSLRAPVRYTTGEREGKYGRVVTSFVGPALSVDVVARAGAGGAFGTVKESLIPGGSTEEGSDMPLTKEERAEIAQETALALASVLKPTFDGFTTALGEIKTARESSAPAALKISQINKIVADAKLTEKAQARVLTAIEAAKPEEVTEKYVTDICAREAEVYAEALEAAKAGEGNLEEEDDEKGTKSGNAQESALPNGWAVPSIQKGDGK